MKDSVPGQNLPIPAIAEDAGRRGTGRGRTGKLTPGQVQGSGANQLGLIKHQTHL